MRVREYMPAKCHSAERERGVKVFMRVRSSRLYYRPAAREREAAGVR